VHNTPVAVLRPGSVEDIAKMIRFALPFVRVFQIPYTDNATFFKNLRTLLNRGELNEVFNFGIPNGTRGFMCGTRHLRMTSGGVALQL
jgi:hypothetical protein